MRYKVSTRDWETLSAYLDGQLSRRKQAHLESRLRKDVHLQAILNELQVTRQILRNAPRLSAPRNFILTPELAGQPLRLPRLSPVFGWASAVASFLFVLVLMGNIMNNGFVPLSSRTSQEDVNTDPASQVVDDNISTLPTMAEAQEAPLMGSSEEAAPLESPEELVPMEVAPEPEIASTATQVTNPEPTDIEVFAAVEEIEPEQPEERSITTVVEQAPSETPGDVSMNDVEEEVVSQEEDDSRSGADRLVESKSFSNTVDTEGSQIQPTELTSEVDSVQSQDEEPVAESIEVKESVSIPELQAVDNDQQPKITSEPILTFTATPTQVVDWGGSVTPLADTHVIENYYNILFGAEVFLALFALGTGFAWFYLRHRGG